MSRVRSWRESLCPCLVLALVTLAGAGQSEAAAQKAKKPAGGKAAVPGGPSAGGSVRVDGRTLTLTHGYLVHAPDAFEATQRNAVVVLAPQALDPAKLDAAKTLKDVLDLAPQRVVFEVKPENKANLSICHDGFGEGKCFSTPVAPFDWKPGVVEDARVSGSVKSFADKEDTVLEKFKLYYDLTFDARGGRSLTARR